MQVGHVCGHRLDLLMHVTVGAYCPGRRRWSGGLCCCHRVVVCMSELVNIVALWIDCCGCVSMVGISTGVVDSVFRCRGGGGGGGGGGTVGCVLPSVNCTVLAGIVG
eukprot:4873349-Amphidinium_carterae.1